MTEPLFISDLDTLKSKLRLSGATEEDTLALVDLALSQVRISLFDALGADRITELLAIEPAVNPLTADEITRAKADLVEVLWVRLHLLRKLPTLFMDAAGSARQNWNEEGLTRNMGQSDLENEIRRLEEEIANLLSTLRGAEPAAGVLQITTIGPAVTPPAPGDSIRPRCWT